MSNSSILIDYMNDKLIKLSIDCPQSKAALAVLRRGAGKRLEDAPETWSYVLTGMPDEMTGSYYGGNTVLSREESAVYTALTLYAVHRQGKPPSVNVRGVSFGRAFGRLSFTSPNSEGVIRRFNSIISASDMVGLQYHLRGAIQLMASSVPVTGFDYTKLANDLYFYQFPEKSKGVMLAWGQDFYKNIKDSTNEEKEGCE